jgi:steroid delta-isomerase-like uncharacterized protein
MAQVIETYFKAFNAGDIEGMLACLTDDVAHHVNEGGIRRGKSEFALFCADMSRCYREQLQNIVIMNSVDGVRAAAEFTVLGTYLEADAGLPDAHGQRYILPAGSFFSLRDGKISRVVTYYNLSDWVRQVSA